MSVVPVQVLGLTILIATCSGEIQEVQEIPSSELQIGVDLLEFFNQSKCISFISAIEPDEDWNKLYAEVVRVFDQRFSFNYFTKTAFELDKVRYKRHLDALQYEGFFIRLNYEAPSFEVQSIFRRNGRYLVLFDNRNEEFMDLITVFKEIWTKIGSINVVIWSRNNLYFFNPFKRDVEANDTFGTVAIYKPGHNLRQEYMRNLYGFPLRLEIFDSSFNVPIYDKDKKFLRFQGPDKEISDVIQEQMNFTVVIQKPDSVDPFGYRLPNGSFTGTLGRLIAKKSDLALTGFFIKDYFTSDLEFTSSLYSDQLCCITKKSSRIPQYLLPLICFEWQLWMCIFLTAFLSMWFWSFLRFVNYRMEHRSAKPSEYRQIIVDTLILMISSPMRKFTRINSERLFIASICLISLVFVSIFQSGLSTVFIKPIYYKDINTLQELERSGLSIHIKYPAMMDDLFPMNGSGYLESLRRRLLLVNLTTSLIPRVIETGSFAATTRRSQTHLDNSVHFISRRAHLITDCPRTYNLAFLGRRHSIYLERINDIILHLLNGGFLQKWIHDLNTNYTWIIRKKYGTFHEDDYKVFTMTDLQLPFFLLSIGATVSFAVFLVEQKKRRKRTKLGGLE